MKRIVFALLASFPVIAASHHGWSEYDSSKTLKLSGKVIDSGYEHPHGQLRLQAPGKTWRVILAPPSRMERRGLEKQMLRKGATVTVEGYASRETPDEMRAERIMVDGKTIELR